MTASRSSRRWVQEPRSLGTRARRSFGDELMSSGQAGKET